MNLLLAVQAVQCWPHNDGRVKPSCDWDYPSSYL